MGRDTLVGLLITEDNDCRIITCSWKGDGEVVGGEVLSTGADMEAIFVLLCILLLLLLLLLLLW
jgi:hypothetical protein